MSVLKGIQAHKQAKKEQAEREARRERPKANYFKIGPDESKVVRFLQELDEESENYDPERGVGYKVVMHTGPGPDGWKRMSACRLEEEGSCFACSQMRPGDREGFGRKVIFYINVLEEDEDGNKTVSILNRNGNSSFVDALYEEAIDEGSITNAMYRITRTGSGTSTNWLLKRLPKADVVDDEGQTPWNLDEYIISVPNERQPKFFGVTADDSSSYDDEEDGAAADW